MELLRRAQLVGYAGWKSALYDLVRTVRVITPRPVVRFEGRRVNSPIMMLANFR